MSTRVTVTLFTHCTVEALHDAIAATMTDFGGQARWHASGGDGLPLLIHTQGMTHTVLLGYLGGIYGFFKHVGTRLGCPWMEARIQEGNHWDYSLMQGEADIHDFNTDPQYFLGDDPVAIRRYAGDADELARLWGIPKAHIERYIVQWEYVGTKIADGLLPGMKTVVVDQDTGKTTTIDGELRRQFALTGKAYPEDEWAYGDYWQLYDFIRALGGGDPSDGQEHRLAFRDNANIYSVIHPQTVYTPRLTLADRLWDAMAWVVDRIERMRYR